MGQKQSRTSNERNSSVHYEHEPLETEDRHVRLLTLYPGFGGEVIRCSLAPHSLNWNPTYEALSYTWGDPNDVHPTSIELNGKPFNIARNLYVALGALRYHNDPRALWVDALCINQRDIYERNRQIGLIGSIYQGASNVVIWLGPKSHDSEIAMSTINSLQSLSDFRAITKEQWSAMNDLFSRPWFSRIWVVQEFKRARNPIFVCGESSFHWDKVGSAIGGFWTEGNIQDFQNEDVHLLGEVGKAASMASTRVDLPTDSDVAPEIAAARLIHMLRIYCSREASVPHDKIYGLLGLSNAFAFEEAHPPPVDYERPFQHVYADWARFLFSTHNRIELLYLSVKVGRGSTLPSWVPDWRTFQKSKGKGGEDDLTITLDVFGDCFAYTGSLLQINGIQPQFSADNRLLSVPGFTLLTFNGDFTFVYKDRPEIEMDVVNKGLERKHPRVLLRICLMMGCKIEKAASRPASDFAWSGIMKGRKQFCCINGSIGLVPNDTEYGDIMCVLGDGAVPFVLRPESGQFRLIGDGYIDVSRNSSFLNKEIVLQTFTLH